MMTLIYQGARLSFYMLLLLSLPVIIEANSILNVWLVTVPEYTVTFVRLVLVLTLFESLSNPLVTAMLATGKIRNYQLVVGGLQMLNFLFLICCYIGDFFRNNFGCGYCYFSMLPNCSCIYVAR